MAQSAELILDGGNARLGQRLRRGSNSRMSSGEYRPTESLGPVNAKWAEAHPRAGEIFAEYQEQMVWLEEGDRPLLQKLSEAAADYERVSAMMQDAEENIPVADAFWKRQTYNHWRARSKDLYKQVHDMLQMMNANGLYRQRREVAGGAAADSQQLTLPSVDVA
ncbi:MAG: hypothetical protein F4107_02545 [Gemmatimonadetes bacterium]|nr:hypothetical protein [Gemmatimonadota bacterium]MYD13954.1 hypothetical protein [Gemmatimonadota bacterium]MYI64804.1 hypothetical protein [Gemmatimonadota bacterium]